MRPLLYLLRAVQYFLELPQLYLPSREGRTSLCAAPTPVFRGWSETRLCFIAYFFSLTPPARARWMLFLLIGADPPYLISPRSGRTTAEGNEQPV